MSLKKFRLDYDEKHKNYEILENLCDTNNAYWVMSSKDFLKVNETECVSFIKIGLF